MNVLHVFPGKNYEVVTRFEQNASSRPNNCWSMHLADVKNLSNNVVEVPEEILLFPEKY